MKTTVRTAAVTAAAGLGIATLVAFAPGTSADAGSDPAATLKKQWKVQNAMSAAPRSVARAATILDWPAKAGAEFAELRPGNNGWTCMPDDPASPGNDPICVDEQSFGWLEAWMSGTDPKLTSPGLSYMLRGGSSAGNTDPFATAPAPGQKWTAEPPHLMVIPSEKLDPAAYSTDHHGGTPYVMWPGTPYEHLMVPVK